MLQFAEITTTCPVDAYSTTDIVAIAGIIGTLAGAALGAYVTWKIQKLQMDHEDKVRFHEKRLAVYAEFTDVSNVTIARFQSGIDSTEHLSSVIRLWETLRLIASEQVINAAFPIHTALGLVRSGNVTNPEELVKTFNADMAKLLVAIRAEIGVDPKRS